MSVIVEFSIEPTSFAMGEALAVARVDVELECVIPMRESAMPLFWATGENLDEYTRQVRSHAVVDSLQVLERYEDTRLYRVRWANSVDAVIEALEETDATVLGGAWDGEWRLRLRFGDREAATQFSDRCREAGVGIDVQRIYVPDARHDRDRHVALTDKQREALRLAYEEGYFSTPKQTDLSELAGQLDISQQALSTRIRRGNQRVLEAILR
jgi:hypothetical protein